MGLPQAVATRVRGAVCEEDRWPEWGSGVSAIRRARSRAWILVVRQIAGSWVAGTVSDVIVPGSRITPGSRVDVNSASSPGGSIDDKVDARHLRSPAGTSFGRTLTVGSGPGDRTLGSCKGLFAGVVEPPGNQLSLATQVGALGQIRTADTRFRRAVLYPLSYEGGGSTDRGGARSTGHRRPAVREEG